MSSQCLVVSFSIKKEQRQPKSAHIFSSFGKLVVARGPNQPLVAYVLCWHRIPHLTDLTSGEIVAMVRAHKIAQCTLKSVEFLCWSLYTSVMVMSTYERVYIEQRKKGSKVVACCTIVNCSNRSLISLSFSVGGN